MWVTELVEIPDPLVEALTDGRLVIFAGAGVSRGVPTELPEFQGLAEELGKSAKIERLSEEELERYLGRIADSSFPLHQEAAARIALATESNRLHRAIIQLAREPGALRVVTTNFDTHLSACARDAFGGESFEEYYAPALPLGDDFSGIVYLHGAAGRDPRSLVLTDIDFSRAYLTRGWARQFLLDLFRAWPVLFIGYSHSDTILTYLARGLSPGTTRFALIRAEDRERFLALDITPIVFPTIEGEDRYQALTQAVEAWVRLVGMGLADHEQRVRELTAAAPPQTQPELDYARSVVRDPVRAPFFRRHASSLEWLAWMTEEQLFRQLFQADAPGDVSLDLALWFAERYAFEAPDAALGVLSQMGGAMSPLLWQVVARHLWVEKASPPIRAKWLPHLLATAPTDTGDFLEYLLVGSDPTDATTALLLFDFLTEPHVQPKRNIFDDRLIPGPLPDLAIKGDLYWLYEAWDKVFQPRLAEFAHQLLDVCSKHLTKASLYSRVFELAGQGRDLASELRPRIDQSEGDQAYRRWSDLLVDVARHALLWMIDNDEHAVRMLLDRWISSDVPLLRRLGVLGIARAPWAMGDEKVHQLLDKGLLFDADVRLEVLDVLGTAAPLTGSETRRDLLAAIEAGPVGVTDELRAAATRRMLLLTLRDADVETDAVNEGIHRIEAAHPELVGEREPATSGVTIEDWSGRRSPLTREELLEKDPADPDFIDWLLSYDQRGWRESRDGLLDVLRLAAGDSFDWSMALAEAMGARDAWGSDVVARFLGAWSEGPLSADQWRAVLAFLERMPDPGVQCFWIADLLERSMRNHQGSPIPHPLLDRAEGVALMAWEACRETEADEEDEARDWLGTAINRSAGKLALFFLRSLSERRAVDGLDYLLEGLQVVFSQMLSQETMSDRLGAVVLASQVHFLHALDAAWVRASLIPAFRWEVDADAAQRTWHGFLTWGRLPPPLIEDLMPLYIEGTAHLGAMSGLLRHRFAEHLAIIALREQQPSGGRVWVDDLIARAEPEDVAAFTRAVSSQLRDLPAEVRVRAWDEWLQRHWARRVKGLPRPMGEGEVRELVAWAVLTADRVIEAVPLLSVGSSAGAYDLFFHDLEASNVSDQNPAATAQLLLHVLRGQGAPFYHCSEALSHAESLTASGKVDASTTQAIQEHLFRLHCT